MKLKQTFYLLTFSLLLLALAACAQRMDTAASEQAAADEDTLAATPLPRPTRPSQNDVTIVVNGEIKAINPTLALGFNTNGRLLTIQVEPGDVVDEGDLIATLDDQALRDVVASAEAALRVAEAQLAQQQLPPDPAQVAQAQLAVAQAESALLQAQAGLDAAEASRSGLWVPTDQAAIIEQEARIAEAQRNYDSARRAHEQLILNEILGAPEEQARLQADAARIALEAAQARLTQLQAGPTLASIESADASIAQSEANITQAEATLTNAQAQLEILLAGTAPERLAVLEAQITQAELNLQQAEQALSQAQLVAPWRGVVLSVEAAPGALVGSGTPIITLLDTEQVEFHTTNLSERDLSQIERGQSVQIVLKTYPHDPITGTVSRIGVQANGVVGDAAVFPVIITLDETALDIRAGMTGQAEIVSQRES